MPLAWDIGRPGKALTDALAPGGLDDFALLPRGPDQVRNTLPGETDIGAHARMEHGILEKGPAVNEMLRPGRRIVLEVDDARNGAPQIDVMDQRVVMETQLAGGIMDQTRQLGVITCRVDAVDEFISEAQGMSVSALPALSHSKPSYPSKTAFRLKHCS
jgi:hypothetical protein